MKTIRVVAAVIHNGDRIFATARGYGDFKGKWEFPGGKIEEGETSQQALVREIKEELDVDIEVGDLIDTVEYDYPSYHLSMECFWSKMIKGKIVLKEAEDAKWLQTNELSSVNWLPADAALINELLLRAFIVKNNWKTNFDYQYTESDCEQSMLSRLIYKKLFEHMLNCKYSCYLKPKDDIALYVSCEHVCKSFLFDVMHNPNGPDEGKVRRHQPYWNADNYNKSNEITFKKIYHTIGNFAPVPRTVTTRNYGPNLQRLHKDFNELWLWLLKYIKENWDEWPTKIHEIMSFEDYMKCSCQHLYYQNLFEKFYKDYTEQEWESIKWSDIVNGWNETIDNENFDGKLISFNNLFDEKNFHEINKRISFIIEARGRCILSLLNEEKDYLKNVDIFPSTGITQKL